MLTSDEIARIAQVYQNRIGPIDSAVAARLRDLAEEYKADDIVNAFLEASRTDNKSWRYIEVYLERRKVEFKTTNPNSGTGYDSNVHSSGEDILNAWQARRAARNQ